MYLKKLEWILMGMTTRTDPDEPEPGRAWADTDESE